jgi:hypothetical protein
MNFYSLTNLNGWTGGKQNRELEHRDRSTQYYEYAVSPEIAKGQARARFHGRTDPEFDCLLLREGMNPPIFKEGLKT